MSTAYELGRKLMPLVDAGIIPRAEYNSLYEVLVEAKNLLPQHAADVDRAVQLIERLLPDPHRPTTGLSIGVYRCIGADWHPRFAPVMEDGEIVGYKLLNE